MNPGRRLLVLLGLLLGVAAQPAPAALRLSATVEAARPGQAFALIVSYQGPGPIDVQLQLPAAVELVSARPTQGSCSSAGQLVSCQAALSDGRPLTIVVEVLTRPQPCGADLVLQARASAGALVALTLVRLDRAPCPTATPTQTPEPEPWRVWLPRIISQQ